MKIVNGAPTEYDDWELYDFVTTDNRKVLMYKKDNMWAVLEEQWEAGERLQYATIFTDNSSLKEHEVLLEVSTLIRAINVSMKWNLDRIRVLEGDVTVAYAFADIY